MTGSGMAGSAGLLTETMAVVPLVLGSVLAGVGYGYFWGSWAECLGRMHRRALRSICVVLLLTALLFVAFSWLMTLALCRAARLGDEMAERMAAGIARGTPVGVRRNDDG